MGNTDLVEILGRLVEADRAAGRSETFVLVYTGGGGRELIGHPGWEEGSEAPSDIEVDELADHRWVRITDIDRKGRHFAVTATGREAWDEHLEVLRPELATTRVRLEWSSARPVLRHIFDAYQDRGAPRRGVDVIAIADDFGERATFDVYVRELARTGYLDVMTGTAAKPRLVKPSPTALQMLAGWPSGAAEDALEGLAHAIDSEIEHTVDPERRSRLESVRSGLVGAARDVALAYFEKKVMGL